MDSVFQNVLRDVAARVQPAVEKAKSMTRHLGQGLTRYVRENPGKSVAAAVVAGFVTARLARRFSW